MTNKQYEAIFTAIAEKLITQEEVITLQNYQIDDLKKKLAEAERTLNAAKENKPAALEIR